VVVHPSQEIKWYLDPDQIEQVLINLIRNATDAAIETGGEVSVGWNAQNQVLEVAIDDTGHGVTNAANLFVPFFTTKPGGTGIGLVLSRQIAEAHQGSLTLENRIPPEHGCRAILRLPSRASGVPSRN
jgi:signal transduction histidine kinase